MVQKKFKKIGSYLSKKCLFCIILASVLYFGWAESLMGQWLLFGNANRQKSGFVWEVERKKQIAKNQLSELVNNRFSIQQSSIDSYANLLDKLMNGNGVLVSSCEFIKFYGQLPISTTRELFSPYFLLKISSERIWESVYLEKVDNKVNIYLLDINNIILDQKDILLKKINFKSIVRPTFYGKIDSLSDFTENLYSADDFFSTLFLLAETVQQKVISSPEKIFNGNGKLLRVGISNKLKLHRTEIGVEIGDDQGGHLVVFFYGEPKAVSNIMSVLKEQTARLKPLNFGLNYAINR